MMRFFRLMWGWVSMCFDFFDVTGLMGLSAFVV